MTSRPGNAAHRATIGTAALLALALVTGASAAPVSDAGLRQMTGTINAVQPDAGTISIITGCGHALRVVVFKAGASCRIDVGGAAAPLASLRSGQIVVVGYRNGPQPYDAETIATVPAKDAGRPR